MGLDRGPAEVPVQSQPSASGTSGDNSAAARAMAQAQAAAEKSARRAEEAARQIEQHRIVEKRKAEFLQGATESERTLNAKQRRAAQFKDWKAEKQSAKVGLQEEGGKCAVQLTPGPWKAHGKGGGRRK